MMAFEIPTKQTVALVCELGGPVEFVDDYPVPSPGHDEVLAKVLYAGVCQSGGSLHRSMAAILYTSSPES